MKELKISIKRWTPGHAMNLLFTPSGKKKTTNQKKKKEATTKTNNNNRITVANCKLKKKNHI